MTSRLLKTPPELLQLIVAHLDKPSLKQLRLTAKAFGSYTVPRLHIISPEHLLNTRTPLPYTSDTFKAIRTTVVCLPEDASMRCDDREQRSVENQYLAALNQMLAKATKLSHMKLVIRVAEMRLQHAGDAFWKCMEALCSYRTSPLKVTLVLEGHRYLHSATLHTRTASHLARIINMVSTKHAIQSASLEHIYSEAEHSEFQQALSNFSPRKLYLSQCIFGQAIRESLQMDQLTHLSIFVDDLTTEQEAHEARMARCAADLVHRAARSLHYLELKSTTPWTRDLASILGTLRFPSLRSFRCNKSILLRIEAMHAPNAADVEVLEDVHEMDFRVSDSEYDSEGSLADECELEKRLEKALLGTASFPNLQRVVLPTLLPGPEGIGDMIFVNMMHRFTSAGIQAKFGLALTLRQEWVDRIPSYIEALSPGLSTLNLLFVDWPADPGLNAWKLPNLVHLEFQTGDPTREAFVSLLRNLDAPDLRRLGINSIFMSSEGLSEFLRWLRSGKTPNLGSIGVTMQFNLGEKEEEWRTLEASIQEVCEHRGIDCRLELERRAQSLSDDSISDDSEWSSDES